MATHVLTNPFLSIDGLNLTQYIREVALSYSAEAVDETASGDGTMRHLGGLKNWSLSATLKQDYGSTAVDATLFDLVGSSTLAIVLRPTTAAVGSGNPEFTATGMLEEYPPLGGAIGELHTSEISVASVTALQRSTST